MSIYLTGDQHFWHTNILTYTERPFATTRAMNEAIVARWNEVVAETDKVFVLGDFAFCSLTWAQALYNQLSGRKILIRGNHDGTAKRCREIGFAEVYRSYNLDGLYLIHNPRNLEMFGLKGADRVACGHVHQHWRAKQIGQTRCVNVGVDVWDFRPVALEMVLGLLADANYWGV